MTNPQSAERVTFTTRPEFKVEMLIVIDGEVTAWPRRATVYDAAIWVQQFAPDCSEAHLYDAVEVGPGEYVAGQDVEWIAFCDDGYDGEPERLDAVEAKQVEDRAYFQGGV